MVVTVDASSGFCWGVIRTITIAEKELENSPGLISLGDIIHNPLEIERLEKKGLSTINVDNLEQAKGKTVLIRAHGEPPKTYQKAKELDIRLIDATCPVVAKVQERIRGFYNNGYQIVIFGKKDHAEIIGLIGQTNGEAIVINSLEEIDKIKFDRKTVLFSQTTMDKALFHAISEEIQKRIKDLIIKNIKVEPIEFLTKDTICGQVSSRDKKIREFARLNEVIIFVAGRQSSNGKVLFNIAKEENARTYFIETPKELKKEWFSGVGSVGVTGATSSPQWLMEQVKKIIETKYASL